MPSQMRMLFGEGRGKGGPRVKGPRFYNVDASPFEDPRRVVGGGGGLGGYDTAQQDNNNHNNNYMISIPSEPPRTHYPNSITTTANSTFYS